MQAALYKLLLAFLLILVGIAPGYAVNKDVTVISSSRAEFHFRVRTHFADLERRIEADSSVTFFKSIHVGIPYDATVALLSVQSDSLIAIAGEESERYRLSSQSYPLVVVSDPVIVRGRQFVVVRVFPVVGKATYREVSVKLGFTGGLTQGGTPANDPQFDRIFKAILANFDQFKTWPVPSRSLAKLAQIAQGPFGTVSTWYKIAVNQTGLYKVSGAQLEQAGLVLDNLSSDSIHLFNGGGLPLEVHNSKQRPVFTEISIMVEDGGDGAFNSSDYIVFYGESVDRWLYRGDTIPRFVNNPYTDRNIYWLAVSGFPGAGLRMNQIDAVPNGSEDTIITTFQRRVHSEQDNLLLRENDGGITDYYTWYWTNEPELTFFVPTPGVVEGDTANIWLFGRTSDNSDPGDSFGFMDLYVNDVRGLEKSCNGFNCSYRTAALVDGLNEIRLMLWPNLNAPPYFDYMNLEYSSRLVPTGEKLDIPLGTFAGSAQIEVIDNFSFPMVILNISDPLHPVALTGYERAGGVVTFHVDLEAGSANRFYLGTIPHSLTPLSIAQANPFDLRTASAQIDLLIVTSKEFEESLHEYIDYRRAQGYSITVVSVEDIMDNFGYGLYDPTAIRDFFKYAYDSLPSPPPSAVLLVGDGNYDFLDHLGTGMPNYVPSYILPANMDESASDDNYVYFGEYGFLDSDTSYDTSYVTRDRGYDMIIARWPVRNVYEINTILTKIKQYESPTNFGFWRTNITLVADDEVGKFNNETFHVTHTEELEKNCIPPLFHRSKIYLWDYPLVNGRKPAVNDAIVNSINKGTLLINFVGHGNPDAWAHEYVFSRTGDLPRLNNYDRLPLFFTASCAIGFFDDPKREGMAEDLLIQPNGGAIGVVSATRLVYASENALFNQKVFDVLLYNDSLSTCEAIYTAKLLRQYGPWPVPQPEKNDRAYLFFGDPYLKLGMPQLDVEFSETPDSLIALGLTQIAGRIINKQNEVHSRDGVLLINVYDSERDMTYRLVDNNGVVTQKIDYTVTGPTIYRGSATITGGFFDFEFVSPLDISYGGKGAKIVVYAMFDSTDAAGLIDSLTVSDSIVALSDSTGPTIEYAFPNRNNFVSGDLISKMDVLEITASDLSGINLTGGLGHGITLEIDDQSENTVNLTNLFEYNQNDHTTGKVVYPLESLVSGKHTFKIKAWDNANNSAAIEFSAEVLAGEKLAIVNLLNYPNPMKESTRFSLELTRPAEKLILEIFTLSGRRIKSFGPLHLQPGYYDDIVWDGHDASGDRVATGVYIYKATAVPEGGGDEIESFGKLVVIN